MKWSMEALCKQLAPRKGDQLEGPHSPYDNYVGIARAPSNTLKTLLMLMRHLYCKHAS